MPARLYGTTWIVTFGLRDSPPDAPSCPYITGPALWDGAERPHPAAPAAAARAAPPGSATLPRQPSAYLLLTSSSVVSVWSPGRPAHILGLQQPGTRECW